MAKVSCYVRKADSANSLPLTGAFLWGAYFCMGAYKSDVVAVIKMDAYVHGCLFCVGAYNPDFMVYVYLVG